MSALVGFMNGPVGRLARVALGVAIIITAFTAMSGTAGWIVAAVGLVPIALGVSGRCLIEVLPGARSSR
ncbi:MAG: DUF2892 domain-containing protein [Dehalococcoidia bacterium]